MVRHSKKNKKGGSQLDNIQSQLDELQEKLNMLKNKEPEPEEKKEEDAEEKKEEDAEEKKEEEAEEKKEEEAEEKKEEEAEEKKEEEKPVVKAKPIVKSWVDDKNTKFNSGDGGRVTLSFSRLMTLIQNNISKNDSGKNWSKIKTDLQDANNKSEVQESINKYKINFSSNYVAGTKRRRRNRKGRGTKKY